MNIKDKMKLLKNISLYPLGFINCIIFTFSFMVLSNAQIPNREWSTYHGGDNEDSFRDIAIDAVGNVYVVGSTRSSNAIITPPSSQSMIAGGSDVFLAKYDTNGSRIWATYFGGEGDDFGQSIDLDANGNIFITGLTFSNNGIATAGTHQSFNSGNGDTFVAKFTSTGAVVWGSYLGGNGFDFANDIEIDITGNPSIVGWTNSVSNIVTVGAFQNTLRGQDDALVAKFDTNGQLLWATYFGDIGFDTGLQIESDGFGNIIASGWTSSTANIATAGAFQTTYGGSSADGFLVVFNSSGSRNWATYYGGSGDDYGDALFVTIPGDIYLSGFTNSPNNIASPSAYQPNIATGFDSFLARFSSAGTRFWGTYFGGNGDDTAFRIREGNDAAIFMVGHTSSTNNISTANAYQINKSGSQDVFLSRFENDGSLSWSTYYGGMANDFGYGLVIDASDDIFIIGNTEGSTNLSTNQAVQLTYGGGTFDGFITKFSLCTPPVLNFNNSGFTCSPVNYVFEMELIGQPPFTIYYSIDGIEQSPWITSSSTFFPNVDAIDWTKIIQIDSVKSGSCLGNINSVYGFVQVRDSIRATIFSYVCDEATQTYTVNVDLSGGAFGKFQSIGPNTGFIDNITNRFTSLPIPYDDNYSFQFTEIGTFSNCDTITLMGVAGCKDPCLPLNVTSSSNSPVCAGSTLSIMAEGGTSYIWQGPNGFAYTGQNPLINEVTAINAGTYTVTATDSNGCTGVTSVNVTIIQPSSGSISSNSPVCFGDIINLNVTGGTQYTWSGPNNFSSTEDSPKIPNASNLNAGEYFVTVTDVQGCIRIASVMVNVTNQINPQVSSNGPLCNGTTLNLMASGGVSYQWNGPSGYSSNLQNPSIINTSIQNSGNYTVTVTAANNCFATASIQVIIHDLTTVNISSNTPVCVGNQIILMVSEGISYQWSGPNGFMNSTQNPVIDIATLQNSGLYSVTVTSAEGCTGTAIATLLVNPLPVPTINANSPLCIGNNLQLMSSGGDLYNWSGPNGFVSTLQNPVIDNITSLSAGSYTLTVTASNSCTASTNTIVTLNQGPIIIASSNSPVCHEGDINLQLSGGVSYQWQGPNNFTSSAQNPTLNNVNLSYSGTYNVTVTGQNGCTTIASTNVIVNGQLNVNVTSNSPVCEGDTLRLTADKGVTFMWSGPNGFDATSQNPIIPISSADNTGNYILTVTDVFGCTGAAQISALIKPKPIAIITGDQEACLGTTVTLQSPSQGVLLWSTGEIDSSIKVRPISNTTYTLITDINGCKDTASYIVNVKPLPIVEINPFTASIVLGESVQLAASGADNYEWSPVEGLSCTLCFDPLAAPLQTTRYCVVGTIDGCEADTCMTITIKDDCLLVFPNIFSPNSDGLNDAWCSKAQDCIISQNLSIYDRWGNLIYQTSGEEVCWYGDTKFQNNVYTYLLQLVRSNGKTEVLYGSVTLVR
jgi:gliding motility-associated-like protein